MIRLLMRKFVAVVAVLSVFLSACSDGKDDNIDLSSLSSEAIFSEDWDYAYLAQLLNGISQNDIWEFAEVVLDNLNAAVRAGEASPEDVAAVKAIIKQVYEWMGSDEIMDTVNGSVKGRVVELLDIMVDNHVGDVITQIIAAAGPDILTENIYPLLAYLVSFDTSTLANAVSGVSISDITLDASQIDVDDFKQAMNALNGVFSSTEDGGKYHDIYAALMDLYEDIKNSDDIGSFTVGDVRDLLDVDIPLLDMEAGNVGLYADIVDALWGLFQDDPKIKEDISKFLHAAGYWTGTRRDDGDSYNSWADDTELQDIPDFQRVLLCLKDILKPDTATRNNRAYLKKFVLQAIDAVKYLDGADNVFGITNSLASIDPNTDYINDCAGFDNAIYECFFMNNMNRRPTATAADSIKASLMQSIFLLFDEACVVSDTFKALSPDFTPFLLSVAFDLDDDIPEILTDDLVGWIVGVVGETLSQYDATYAYSIDSLTGSTEDRPYPDPMVGMDWLNYDASVGMLYCAYFSGFSRMFNLLKDFDLVDYVTTLVTISGISGAFNLGDLSSFTESLAVWDSLLGCTGTKHSSGDYHRLWTFAGPLARHYYEQGYGSQLFHVVGGLNEISLDDYVPLTSLFQTPTYKKSSWNTAWETIQGPNGYGACYYLLRGESTNNDNEDMADPLLDLLVRVFYKLRHTGYEDSNLLRAVCDDIVSRATDAADQVSGQTDYTIDDLVEDLFATDGPIDYLYTFLEQNHNQVASVFEDLGKVLMAMVDQSVHSADLSDEQKGDLNIVYVQNVTQLLEFLQNVLQGKNGQIKLGTVLTQHANDISEIVVNVLNQAGVDDSKVLGGAAELVSVFCNRGEELCEDLGYAVPVLVQLFNAFKIEGTYEFSSDDLQPLWDYLVADVDGEENKFIFNLKSLLYKVAGIYDATYNTSSNSVSMRLDDTTPLMDILEHLFGDDGLYDLMPVIDFLGALTAEDNNLLIDLLEVGKDVTEDSGNIMDIIGDIFGEDSEYMFSMDLIKSLFVSYEGNDAVVLAVLNIICLEHNGEPLDFNGVFNDLSNFLKANEFKPGEDFFGFIYNVMELLVKSYDI